MTKRRRKHSLCYNIFASIASIPLIIVLYVIAGICWLVQHVYNLCTGKGWTGLPLK